jgi:hypothetical protein
MNRIVLFSPLFMLACPGPESGSDPGLYDGPEFGRIAGYVTDVNGDVLTDVEVVAQSQSVFTNSDGLFNLDGISPEEDILLTFRKDGFARGYSTATVLSWETASASGTLLEIDGIALFDSTIGGDVTVGEVDISFDANTVVDAAGNAYSGTVTVAVTHIDPSTPELAAGPGDLQALAFDTSGTSKDVFVSSLLISYGMVEVSLTTDEGEELNLAEDSAASIEMPITNGALANVYRTDVGETRQTWSFDTDRRRWIEEGVGNVVAGEEEGELRFSFEATHFSWWNSDQGAIPTCASGRVVDYLGFPVRGAEVNVGGVSSGSRTQTDKNGYYVATVLAGRNNSFSAKTHVASRDWTSQQVNIYVDCPNGSHFCEVNAAGIQGACYPVPDLQIDVCRITGAVTVENMTSVIEDDRAAIDADHASAVFFEPRGDIEYCQNPWSFIAEEQCQTLRTEDFADFLPSSAEVGLPESPRSVGSYVEISTSAGQRVNLLSDSTRGIYNFASTDQNDANSIEQVRPEFNGGDVLSVNAPGSSDYYFGAWSESRFAMIPSDIAFQDSGSRVTNASSGIELSYTGNNNFKTGLLAFANTANSSTATICRFTDDGHVRIPAQELSQLGVGFGGLGIFHLEDGYAIGPDGLPIRLQLFSGASTSLEIQ